MDRRRRAAEECCTKYIHTSGMWHLPPPNTNTHTPQYRCNTSGRRNRPTTVEHPLTNCHPANNTTERPRAIVSRPTEAVSLPNNIRAQLEVNASK